MIVAYCDQCGERVDADTPAGVRLVGGKTERTFHLCPEHQTECLRLVGALVTHAADGKPSWREVKA